MISVDECLICGSEHFHTLMPHNIFVENGSIVQCGSCGFVWSRAQLENAELKSFYKNKYRNLKQERLTFGRFKNDVQRTISQASFYQLQSLSTQSPILEIGPGWGASPKYLYKEGFNNVTVVEPDERVKNLLPVSTKILGDVHEASFSHFSLIIMSHVLEHIFNIESYLNELTRIAKKGACLFIEVPNCENEYVLSGSDQSYHYWFFTHESLVKFMELQGFKLIKVVACGKDKFDTNGMKHDNLIKEYDFADKRSYWLRGLFEIT